MKRKRALITGASTGIGREYAFALAEKGYDLVLVARSRDKLDALAHELKKTYKRNIHVIVKDLSIASAPEEIYVELKDRQWQIDMLINNAGAGSTGQLLERSLVQNQQQVMLNVNAVVNMTHLFLQDMVARKQGDVINVASMASFQPIPYMSIYAATKSFVLSFTEGLHEEYSQHGIRVIAVCPGNTQTQFFDQAPDSIKVGKMRSSRQVVETSFKGLRRNQSYIVDGKMNKLLSELPRFLPRRWISKMSARLMKKTMSHTNSGSN
ncbi:SDR family NAD(P)-dependent oxidoreductase [Marinicrinis sediminis]|uniref:SDR family NAD(P)-dependent oxidoreductase n=1 Tax=Marinicrinis sediminis TaxID=1652465 RepID=A0ABW5R609_9BACL